MAAAIARYLNPGLEVISRGIAAPKGEPISGIAAEALKRGGIPILPHSSAPITASDVNRADLILTMTLEQKQYVTRTFPKAKGKLFRIKENGDISDPTLWDLDVYERVREDIAVALAPWLLKCGRTYEK